MYDICELVEICITYIYELAEIFITYICELVKISILYQFDDQAQLQFLVNSA